MVDALEPEERGSLSVLLPSALQFNLLQEMDKSKEGGHAGRKRNWGRGGPPSRRWGRVFGLWRPGCVSGAGSAGAVAAASRRGGGVGRRHRAGLAGWAGGVARGWRGGPTASRGVGGAGRRHHAGLAGWAGGVACRIGEVAGNVGEEGCGRQDN